MVAAPAVLVIHEAFQAGVPVLGSRTGGIPELVVDERSGLLFDSGSSSSLAAALGRLLAEPGLLDRLAAGIPPVRSLERDAERWEEIYREVLH